MLRLSLLVILIFSMSCSSVKEKEVAKGETVDDQRSSLTTTPDSLPVAEEDRGRTEWQNPQLVLSTLGDLSGKIVADIGAGSGYFALKMAQTAEKVIALDIDPKALEYIDEQIEIVGDWAQKIETRLTPSETPNLEQEEVDAVLIVNTYFYLPDRSEYLNSILGSLKENGKLVVVDYKIGNTPVGPSDDFKVKPEEIESEIRAAGFKSVSLDLQSLEYQYVISAEKH